MGHCSDVEDERRTPKLHSKEISPNPNDMQTHSYTYMGP